MLTFYISRVTNNFIALHYKVTSLGFHFNFGFVVALHIKE